MLQIGPVTLPGRVLLAPMAGITDGPFRDLCRSFGAGLTASEMTTADTRLWSTAKSRRRLADTGNGAVRVIQIAGSDPAMMADAARRAVDAGADVVDINMGCPAKKVCRRLAGSALLQDEDLAGRILDAVAGAVDAPVTLKMRTGPHPGHRNGVRMARMAESSGIRAIAVHGRTRACRFKGRAEFDTIRRIKAAVSIPVFANGDIDSPQRANEVIEETGADGVMLGRAVRGQPWLFDQVNASLEKKVLPAAPSLAARRDIILAHLDAMYVFYGEYTGVRVARKHLGWYLHNLDGADPARERAVRASTTAGQMQIIKDFFAALHGGEHAASSELTPPGVSHQCRKARKKALP